MIIVLQKAENRKLISIPKKYEKWLKLQRPSTLRSINEINNS